MAAPALAVYAQGLAVVSADELNTFFQTCDTVSQLRAFIGVPGQEVWLRGLNAINDGAGGPFYWNINATGPDDGVNVIVPYGAGTGAWIRNVTSTALMTTGILLGLVKSLPIAFPGVGGGLWVNYSLYEINVTAGGSGYTSAPTVTISGATANTLATATATVTSGALTSVRVTAIGSGYQSVPNISFSGGGGSGAAATAVLSGALSTA